MDSETNEGVEEKMVGVIFCVCVIGRKLIHFKALSASFFFNMKSRLQN